mgnify:CR=1 FL=1
MIQQIIELSRIQDDDSSGSREALNVNDLAVEAIERSDTDARAKSIDVTHADSGPAIVFGNRLQLLSAISNLVENAVTYSPDGSKISVSVRTEADRVLVVVTDNGIGISAEDTTRVFERFYRVDPARARSTGGTGLGLSIVKHVAASHGGTIEVWSEPGVGSTFTMALPGWESDEGEDDDPSLVG